MKMGLLEPVDSKKQIAEIVFNARTKPMVSSLFKVKARSGELYESTVNQLFTLISKSKAIQNCTQSIVKRAL
jgi:hypothetical protein